MKKPKELRALERIENFLKENCVHYKQPVGYIREALTRLESIDKLQKELGCPLEVIFEALKTGTYNGCGEHHIVGLVYIGGMWNKYMLTCFDEQGKPNGSYPLDEYKKTWWLKEDKSE